MWVQQAIFTSARTSKHQGYQIVARSPKVNDRLALFLSRWGPTHGSLTNDDVHAASINYLPIDREWAAVSRTLYGGPEYSGRGALQVVTMILVLERNQFAGYDDDPTLVARTSLLLGHLWLSRTTSPKLPPIDLPERPPRHALGANSAGVADDALLHRSLQTLRTDRVALIGVADPLATVGQLVRQLPPAKRLELSFTTGLIPSQHRRFRLHMLPDLNATIHGRLTQQGIRFLASTV